MNMIRLDQLLVNRGLVSNRTRAAKLIDNGKVMVSGEVLTKAGKKLPADIEIELLESEIKYVSRGAFKLIEALDHWKISPESCICLDIGASTGGFTQVLLERGAAKVYAIDTGSDQLTELLRNDERVVNLEKTNFRHADGVPIHEKADLAVMDVSFISQTLLYPSLKSFVRSGASIITLIKPQFEAGRDRLGKNGVIKDEKVWQSVLKEVEMSTRQSGFEPVGIIPSPITGGDGNKEFLMYMQTKK